MDIARTSQTRTRRAAGLFFNVTTFFALRTNLDAQQAHHLIWTPDALGSVCFLVASELAFAEVGHHLFSWLPRSRSWRIAAFNLFGSVAFGVSALASYVLPTTGEPASVFLTNLGTFVGAICFLVGALLLLPERTHPESEPSSASRPRDDHGPAQQTVDQAAATGKE